MDLRKHLDEASFEAQTAEYAGPPRSNGTDKQCYPNAQGVSMCVSGLTTIRGGEYFYFPSIPGSARSATRSQKLKTLVGRVDANHRQDIPR
jgi:hypothetical protein